MHFAIMYPCYFLHPGCLLCFTVDHSKFKTGVQAAEAAPDRGDKQAFNYEEFWSEKIEAKKRDHSYRVFRNVERDAESFPRAKVGCSGSHVN